MCVCDGIMALTCQLNAAAVSADDRLLRQLMMGATAVHALRVRRRHVDDQQLAGGQHVVFAVCVRERVRRNM